MIGGNDVSDVRHAISLAAELTNKYAGELYISESGHFGVCFFSQCRRCSCHGLSRSSRGSFRIHAGSPAAIGLVMADTAMKASAVHITRYMTPSIGTSHSNEVILALSGDASADERSCTPGKTDRPGTADRNGKLSGNSGRTVFITIPPIYYCRQMP